MKRASLSFWSTLAFSLSIFFLWERIISPALADDKPLPPVVTTPAKSPPADLHQALNVNELKIEMAESQLKLRPSDKTTSELIAALEEFLNQNCFGDLAKTLSYSGPPKDEKCIARMEKLLLVNPDNPAALCLRDGLDAQSCKEAYRRQRLVAFMGNNMPDLDPALKVGASAYEKALLDKIQLDLAPLDAQWTQAKTDDEKKTIIEAALPSYERMMNTACRIVVLRVSRIKEDKKEEDPEIKEARERLSKIPENLRGEYQEKMISDAEEKLAQVARNKDPAAIARITALITAIRNPGIEQSPLTANNSERLRYVLPQCADVLKAMKQRLGDFPAPLCHTDGWYSPQCISAIKSYRARVREEAENKKRKAAGEKPRDSIASF
jgi:hypothetical protein